MQRRLRTEGRESTQALAGALARGCRELFRQAPDTNVFIGLSGELGAGKTTFVQGFVEALEPGRGREVTSPTYALVQRYDTTPPVTHLDLYRLTDLASLEAIGYRDLYHEPGVTVVEWADRVPEAMPSERLDVRLEASSTALGSEEWREVALEPHGRRFETLLERALT